MIKLKKNKEKQNKLKNSIKNIKLKMKSLKGIKKEQKLYIKVKIELDKES